MALLKVFIVCVGGGLLYAAAMWALYLGKRLAFHLNDLWLMRGMLRICRQSNRPLPFYFALNELQIAETKEYYDGRVIADYASTGELVGIEILAV